jgi:hypothetical protein
VAPPTTVALIATLSSIILGNHPIKGASSINRHQ